MLQLLSMGLLGLLLISLLIFKLTQRIARASPPHRRPLESGPDTPEEPVELEAEETEGGPGEGSEPVLEAEVGEEAGEGGIAAALEEVEDGEAVTAGGGPEGYDRGLEEAFVGIEPETKERGDLGDREEGERREEAGGMEAFPEEKLEEAYMGYEGEGAAVGPAMAEAPRQEAVAPSSPPLPHLEERVKEEKVEAEPPEAPKEEIEGMEVGEGTSAAGMTVSQTNLKALSGAVIAAIERGGRTIEAEPGEKILVGDSLLIRGPREARERAKVVLQKEVRRIHLQQVIDQLAKKQKDLEEAKELKKSLVAGKSELLESLEKRHRELMVAYEKGVDAEIDGEKGRAGKPAEAGRKKEEPKVGAGKGTKKRAKDLSPKEYRDCFGNAEDYEKCKRDCGSEEECAKAVRLLEDV